MKRDFDLIRQMMLLIEQTQAGELIRGFEFDEQYEPAVIGEHVYLLIQAGLIEGNISESMNAGAIGFAIRRLTWEGYNFIGAAKDETAWAKAKKIVIEPLGGVAFDLLKEYLKRQAMVGLGLS